MICKICKHKTKQIFKAKILNKYDISYFYCENCGFLQTEEPFWLEEAYKEPISISDTGYLQRNINISQKLTILLTLFFNKNEKFLDYGGGYGVLVRLMRDIGFDFYWFDKYTSNLFARGFEHQDKNKYEAVTAFECFEHFVNPTDEIEKMLELSRNIIFSTELLPYPIPNPEDWWYYGLEHGQHISFYSTRTLNFIANKYGLNYYKGNNIHLFTEKKLSRINLSVNLRLTKIGFHNIVKKLLKSKTLEDRENLIYREDCNEHKLL